MVSPHPDWEDTAEGYRNGDVEISVKPAYVESGAVVYYARGGEPAANAYAVSFRTGLETGSGSYDVLVVVDDPRTAWEFANLVTRYAERADGREEAISKLEGLRDAPEGPRTPDGVVTDVEAEEVLERMVDRGEEPIRVRNA